jgi:hypothetical protein
LSKNIDLSRNQVIKIRSTIFVFFGMALTSGVVNAIPPQPLVRDKSCPNDYYSSGSYCIPNNNAKFAIERIGSCPSGYYSSSTYCVASSNNSKLAIPRISSCPSGYYSSGNYCLSNK